MPYYRDIEHALEKMKEGDTEPMFSITRAPEAYKDESVVVLAKKIVFQFYSKQNPVSYSYLHTRVLLNDLRAVAECSEYYFDKSNDRNAVSIKVIKKDGREQEVDLSEAVEEGIEVKTGFLNLTLSDKQNKIAIKDLQVGDIIDYSYVVNKWTWRNNFKFTYGYYLSGAYPVVGTKVIFEYDQGVYVFGYKGINGAPEFKRSAKGKGMISYCLEDSMRNKYEEEIESERALDEPYFKVELLHWQDLKNKDFIYKKGVEKKQVTEADLKRAANMTRKQLKHTHTDYYLDYVMQEGYQSGDKEYLVRYFYFLRDRIFTPELAFEGEAKNQGISMIGYLIKAAEKRNIKYDFVLFREREDGPLENALFESEIFWGIKFNTKEGEVGFYSFNPFSHPDEVSLDFESTQAYYATPGKGRVKTVNLPFSETSQNKSINNITAAFINGTDSVSITHHSVLSGYYRNNERYTFLNRYNSFSEYLEQVKGSNKKEKSERYYFFNSSAYREANREFIDNVEEEIRKTYRDQEQKRILNNLKREKNGEEYTLLKYDTFRVINDSRSPGNHALEWEEKFTVGEVTAQVNRKDLVFEIGKLAGSMYQINRDRNRQVRNGAFYINTNRMYEVNLDVKIPEGYQVTGLTALNTQLENQLGSFKTTATIEGDHIKITLTKTYKAGRYAKELWPDYIEFLDFAAGFNSAAVILTQK